MNRFSTILALFVLIAGVAQSHAQDTSQLKIWTEEYPPYNYMVDGKVQGTATELVLAVLERINSGITRDDIQLVPWARAYSHVLSERNSILYVMTRSKHREHLFKWVCPVGCGVIGLIGRKDENIEIHRPEDFEKYRIGVVREDIGHQLMSRILHDKDLDIARSSESNLRKLKSGRIDLFSYDVSVTDFLLNRMKLNPDEYETVYILDEAQLCIAFNKDADDELVDLFQKTLDSILAEKNTKSCDQPE